MIIPLQRVSTTGITISRGCGDHGVLVSVNWKDNVCLTPELTKKGELKATGIDGIMYLTADEVLDLMSLLKSLYDDKLKRCIGAF